MSIYPISFPVSYLMLSDYSVDNYEFNVHNNETYLLKLCNKMNHISFCSLSFGKWLSLFKNMLAKSYIFNGITLK